MKDEYKERDENYVCPQCGPDKIGAYAHALVHHSSCPISVEEVIP